VVSNRTRIPRPAVVPITPRAVVLFRAMQRLPAKCTCPDVPPRMECPACEDWWAANNELCRLLQLRVWHWPAICWGGDPVTEEWQEPQASLWHALDAAGRAQPCAKVESPRHDQRVAGG
jgi:hypothetical protein